MSSSLLHPTVSLVVQVFLGLALLLSFWRLARGPRAVDRVAALDFLTGLFLCLTAWQALRRQEAVWLDVSLLLAVLSFAGTCFLARYLAEQRNSDDSDEPAG